MARAQSKWRQGDKIYFEKVKIEELVDISNQQPNPNPNTE